VTASRTTRGKSRPGRLRLIDDFAAAALVDSLRAPGAVAVDLGLGARPWTTLEMAARLRAAAPGLEVVGVDNHAGRVHEARAISDAVRFVVGGFDVPGPPAALIRAMNVLRQYPLDEVAPALARLRRALAPGGSLIEGTSSHSGDAACARWLVRGASGPALRGLIFACDGARGFAPRIFLRLAPRGLEREVAAAVSAWEAAWAPGPDAAAAFAASASRIGALICPGVALWRP